MSPEGLRFTLDVEGLSPDTFAVVAFHYTGSYSSLFRLDVNVSSALFSTLSHEKAIEKGAILKIWRGETLFRLVKGIVTSFSRDEYDGQRAGYRIEIRPPFWRCLYRQNFRSFQNQDIETILATLLAENGVTEYSLLLGNKHPVREFCVQYGESDYAFLLRLLSEEGISFFEAFADDGESQWLIFSDDAAHLPPPIEMPFNPNLSSGVTDEFISQINHTVQIRPSSVVSKDYTFKRPGWQGQFREEGVNQEWQRTQYEIFDYPGRFKDEQHGTDFTRYQVEGFRNNAEIALCESNSAKLWAGRRLTVTAHPLSGLNRTWQVVGSEFSGRQPQAKPGICEQGTVISNRFRLIPADITWRPTPLPKPKVDGPQSATVTGPEDEEIFCDEYGRVRVKFAWDRYNKANQDSSCWGRVSQAWAGTGFGNLAIPRVGQEVIVDFLNGDPDQPIIMGRTYREDNKPQGELPGSKTQMSIRSKTYKGGGCNEIRFEDATGREEVYLNAEKDMNHVINNDRTSLTKRHAVDKVQGNSAMLVNKNQVMQVGGTQSTTIGGDYVLSVGNGFLDGYRHMKLSNYEDNVSTVLKQLAFSVGSNGIVPGMGNMTTFVQGSRIEHINLTDTSSVLGAKIINAGERISISSGTILSLTAGGNSKDICGEMKIIQAVDGVEIRTGSSSIVLQSDGQIKIKGTSITIEGNEEVMIKSAQVNIERK